MIRIKSYLAKETHNPCVAFMITFIIIAILYVILEMAPFGTNALSDVDARIQYIDYFSYLKQILSGNGNLTYSFNKGLGSNVWAVIAYYLLSPFNLLVVFFNQENINVFYDLLVIIKLSLCSGTMAFYLDQRFEKNISPLITVLLSISFGLMQYNLEQAKNVMWLDSVYLLPLLLLGIYKIEKNKGCTFFIVTAALAFWFNWYMGFIAVMFAIIWATWEYIDEWIDNGLKTRAFILYECKVILSVFLAIGLSSVVLIPAFSAMASGRAGIDWQFLNFHYSGDKKALLQGLMMGTISQQGKVSLFAGSFPLVGAISYFVFPGISRRKKIIGLLWIFFPIVIFYWQPLFFLFSLLKDASSYWYRYSFVAIFPMIFLAARYFSQCVQIKKLNKERWLILLCVPIFFLILEFIRPLQPFSYVIISAFIYSIITGILYYHEKHGWEVSLRHGGIILFIIVCSELAFNAGHIMHIYYNSWVNQYQDYVTQARSQIKNIQQLDSGLYRINQVHPFLTGSDNTTANYNEPLAYGYKGLSSYTSSPDNIQLSFMDKMGYRKGSVNLNVMVNSVIGTDALLGVKYILSPIPIDGLEIAPEINTYNQEYAYYNKYALPMAFVVNNNIPMKLIYDDNPFIYQNKLYSALIGQKVQIYKDIPFASRKINEKHIKYILKTDNLPTTMIYGNIPTKEDVEGDLIIDSKFKQGYSRWLAPSVFYISHDGETREHVVDFQLKKDENKIKGNARFYYVDLNTLGDVTTKLKDNPAHIHTFKNGYIEMDVNATNNQVLFTSIPFDKGWQIYVNGEDVKPVLIADCLMGIRLQEGTNKITMSYSLPGLLPGIGISCISLVVFLYLAQKQYYRRKINL